ncbi:MAG TPA: AsmA-like C-terminal region-containing protein, partial [Hyphomicrobiaceae bacterium]|nr:AsmA-like C-terminal region-containing protein [Hyphomicrobiaceae bacterium]
SLKIRAPFAASGQVAISADRSDKAKKNRLFYDLAARLDTDAHQARLSDLTIAFANAGRPQLLTGSTVVSWHEGLRFESKVASRWLDLDSLLGLPADVSPLSALGRLAQRPFGVPTAGGALFDVRIDQANLGQASVSNIRLQVSHADGHARVERAQADLPGRTKFLADGVLRAEAEGPVFAGHVIVSGSRLGQFATWARSGLPKLSGRAAAVFAFEGDVNFAPRSIAVARAGVQVAGGTLRGEGSYDWKGKPKLAVELEAHDVDLSGFGDELLSSSNAGAALGFTTGGKLSGGAVRGEQAAAQEVGALARFVRGIDLAIDVQGRNLRDRTRTVRQLAVSFTRSGSQLRLSRSRIVVANGWTSELAGTFDITTGRPVGAMTGLVGADSKDGVRDLVRSFKQATGVDMADVDLSAAVPLRIAFSSEIKQRVAPVLILTGDGVVRGDRVQVSLESSGPFSNWRNQKLRLDAGVVGGDAYQTASWLKGFWDPAGFREPAARRSGEGGGGAAAGLALRLSVTGVPNTGMVVTGSLDSAPLGATVIADARVDEQDRLTWSGMARVNAASLGRAAELFAKDLARYAGALPVSGRLEIERRVADWRVAPQQLGFGSSLLNGDVVLKPHGTIAGGVQISGELKFDHASIEGLAAPLLAAGKGGGAAQPEGEGGARFWSDKQFDLAGLAKLSGTLKLRVGSLETGPDLRVKRATLVVQLAPGRVVLVEGTGMAGGGKLLVSGEVSQAAAGVKFSGKGLVTGVDLGTFGDAVLRGRLAGLAKLSLEASGQGINPRSLVSQVKGKGRITVGGGVVPGIAADILAGMSRRVVGGEIEPSKLADELQRAAMASSIRLPASELEFVIRDGALHVQAFDAGRGGGRARNTTTVDLMRLRVDSVWSIQPKVLALLDVAEEKQLPPVQVIYVGPLGQLSSVMPQIGFGDLERELTVRRMEADVARLERLRREDEARAKAEELRLQQLEIERQKALEAERERIQPQRLRGRSEGGGQIPTTAAARATVLQQKPDLRGATPARLYGPERAQVPAGAGGSTGANVPALPALPAAQAGGQTIAPAPSAVQPRTRRTYSSRAAGPGKSKLKNSGAASWDRYRFSDPQSAN